jgi:branched-chain amino acid transport system permease protein
MLQQIISGLESGSWYSLLALSIVIVMKATDVPNFAQAQIGLVAAFVAWWTTTKGVPFGLAVLIGLAAGYAIGAVIEPIAIRPLIRRGHFPILLMTIGLTFALSALISRVWGATPRRFETPWTGKNFEVGSQIITYGQLITIGAGLLVAAGLTAFFRTPWGVRMRAIAENPSVARLLGVPSGRIANLAWGIGGAIAALAMMLHTQATLLTDSAADALILKGFVAAVIGGFTSLGGAFIGGLAIGVLENLAGAYISSGWKSAVAMMIVFGFLLAKPQGLVRTAKVREV